MLELVFSELEQVTDVDALVVPCSCDGLLYGISLYAYDGFRNEKKMHEQAWLGKQLKLGKILPIKVKYPVNDVKYLLDFPVRKSWRIEDGIEDNAIADGFKNLKDTIIDMKLSSVAIPVKDFYNYSETEQYFKMIRPLLHETFDDMNDVLVKAVVTPFNGYNKKIKLYVERHMDRMGKEITL